MKIFNWFFILFALYFVIVHPAILYYNIPSSHLLVDRSPIMAIVYLLIAVIGWSSVLIYGLTLLYKRFYGLQKGIRRLVNRGKLIHAKIQTVTIGKTRKQFVETEILVTFSNFSGTPINYLVHVWDSKPYLKRYEVGKTIRLRIDPDIKDQPYVVIDDVEPKLKLQSILLFFGIWILVFAAVVGYFIYAYTTENEGYGWRFLTWNHPLIMSLAVLCLFGLIYFALDKLLLSRIGGSMDRKAIKLLFYGIQTSARVKQVSQTGTYINEQPEVKFELEFVDTKGGTHQVSIKEIVPLISLHSVHQPTKKIFYLPDSPTTIALQENLIV